MIDDNMLPKEIEQAMKEITDASPVMEQYLAGVRDASIALQNWDWNQNPENLILNNPNKKDTQQACYLAYKAGRLMGIAAAIEIELFKSLMEGPDSIN